MITQQHKNEINRLRDEGLSYRDIADRLSLPLGTVKSICHRKREDMPTASRQGDLCRQCGEALMPSTQSAVKRFCSDACRMAWWKAHPEALNRKAVYHITCALCGAAFESYGNAHRKYCSRACYSKARRAANV